VLEEQAARNFAAHYEGSENWNCVVAPAGAFAAALACELLRTTAWTAPAVWFAVDVVCLDADRFQRSQYQGITVRSFGSWRVAVWLK
jgi:hypothetical protein